MLFDDDDSNQHATDVDRISTGIPNENVDTDNTLFQTTDEVKHFERRVKNENMTDEETII